MKRILKNFGICSLAVTLLVSCSAATSFAALKASHVEFTETAASSDTPAQVKAEAYVRNASDTSADGSLIIARYDENKMLTDAKIGKISNMEGGQENFVSVSLDAADASTYKAFLWEGDSITPIRPLASKTLDANAALLSGISVDGQLLSGFSADTHTYSVTAAQGAVVPVIKGVTSDNSVYTTTSYGAISSDGQSVSAEVTAQQGDRTETYTVNVTCAPVEVIAHAIDTGSAETTCNVYENLHGANSASGTAGARASSDNSGEEYFFNTVPSDLAGCDYIVGKRYSLSSYQFKLSHDADISVLSIAQSTDMEGYTETSESSGAAINYLPGKFITMLTNAGIEPTYADALLWQSSCTSSSDVSGGQAALAAKYGKNAENFTGFTTKWSINAVNDSYAYRYTKRFNAGSVVTVPQSTSSYGYVVVVKPVQPEAKSLVEQVTDFNYLVGGMDYTAYCNYIGVTPDPNVKSTAVIDANGYALRKFTKGTYLCGTGTQRVIGTVNKLTGLENAYYIASDFNLSPFYGEGVTVNQSDDTYVAANDRRWMISAYTGLSRTVDTDTTIDFNTDAKWFEFKVNKDCEVIILANNYASPSFCTKAGSGWVNSFLSGDAYVALRNGAEMNKYHNMFVKKFKAGDIVEMYNENSDAGSYPIPYMTIVRFE